MFTVIGLFAAAILVIALIVLAMRSGTLGGRSGQSGNTTATKQEQMKDPRGSVRTSGGND